MSTFGALKREISGHSQNFRAWSQRTWSHRIQAGVMWDDDRIGYEGYLARAWVWTGVQGKRTPGFVRLRMMRGHLFLPLSPVENLYYISHRNTILLTLTDICLHFSRPVDHHNDRKDNLQWRLPLRKRPIHCHIARHPFFESYTLQLLHLHEEWLPVGLSKEGRSRVCLGWR